MQLSDRVEVERLRPVPPSIGGFGASGIGTMAAAGLTPHGRPREAFVALYAQWIGAHPCTMSPTKASDISAHRILSDFSVPIGHEDPPRHRILAAGDLNMFYGATGRRWSLPEREGTRWDRFETLGLEFPGSQAAERPAAIVATTGCSRRYTERPDILLPPTALVGQSQLSVRPRFRVTRLPRKGQGPCPQRDRRMVLKRPLSASGRGCHRMRPPVAGPHSIDADTNQDWHTLCGSARELAADQSR